MEMRWLAWVRVNVLDKSACEDGVELNGNRGDLGEAAIVPQSGKNETDVITPYLTGSGGFWREVS